MNEILEKYKSFLIARKQSLNYHNIMRIFLGYLEEQKLDYQNITQEIITNFFNSHPDYEKRTLTQYIKAGRHFYSQFLQIPKENTEWYKIKYFKGHKNTPKFLTIEELGQIISQFCTYENRLMLPNKARVFINFVYMTGLRKEELLKLKRADINLESNPCEIKVIGKGDKERFVYFCEKYSPKLKQELIDYFASEPETINVFNLTIGKVNYFFRRMNKYLVDRKISPHLFRHCVSADTQVFTKKGWKKYNEIKIKDKILTYNFRKNILEYKALINIYKYNINEKINHLKVGCVDTLFTKDHKIIIQKWNWKNKKNEWTAPLLESINKVTNPFRYIVSAKIKKSKNIIGIHKSFVLGILMADGNINYHQTKYKGISEVYYYDSRQITISQSWSANKDKCEIIKEHLIKANIDFTESLSKKIIGNYGKPYQMKTFRICVNSQDWIFNWLKRNKMPKNTIYKLSRLELDYIFRGLILGDGCKQKCNCIEFRGQEPEIIELLQTICTLLGYRSTLSKDNKNYFRLYICKRNYRQISKSSLEKNLKLIQYKGIVWCPETENSTFLAKRNNSIFLTGNSFGKYLMDKGVPLTYIQSMLGHSSIITTMIYLNPTEMQIKKFMEK